MYDSICRVLAAKPLVNVKKICGNQDGSVIVNLKFILLYYN